MKKIEVKKLSAKNAFKVTVYLTIIPLGLMSLVGILLTVIGSAIQEPGMLAIGIPYIIMPLFLVAIYGLFSMLIAVIYNVFSKKFGGLELVVTEKMNPTPPDTQSIEQYE